MKTLLTIMLTFVLATPALASKQSIKPNDKVLLSDKYTCIMYPTMDMKITKK